MRAETAIQVRDEALRCLDADQQQRVSLDLALLNRLSPKSSGNIVGTAIQDAVSRVRKEMARDARPARSA